MTYHINRCIKMKTYFISIFFLVATVAFSQEGTKSLYSGGMLILQPGYTMTTNRNQQINDFGMGIGGILRLYFYDYLTAGIYGGSQRTTYNSTASGSSYINLGYGGPFIGISKKAGRFRYTASAFVGKGSVKNLHVESQNGDVLTEAYLYKYSTIVFSPIFSIDYAVSKKMSLTLQTVCLMAAYDDDKMLYNPVLQIGILFNR